MLDGFVYRFWVGGCCLVGSLIVLCWFLVALRYVIWGGACRLYVVICCAYCGCCLIVFDFPVLVCYCW